MLCMGCQLQVGGLTQADHPAVDWLYPLLKVLSTLELPLLSRPLPTEVGSATDLLPLVSISIVSEAECSNA